MQQQMKYVLPALCLACPTYAAEINIGGHVVASPCVVDIASQNQSVNFGQLRLNEMRADGNASAWKSFEVRLFKCPAGTTSVDVTFNGQPAAEDPTLYANTGTAANAAVQMARDTNKAQVQGNGSSMNVPVDAQRKATFLLAGRVIVSDTTLPGTFNSLVQMNFTYR